jgi:ferritin-like metal-binding protein YciE
LRREQEVGKNGNERRHNMPDNQTNTKQNIQDKLLPYIQDAYAMENQIAETLEKQIDQTKDFPNVQAKIRQHFEQTKQHRARMENCLKAYGKDPSTIKDLGSSLMGNVAGAMAGIRPDKLSRIARDDYVTEHLEIAAYTLLITTARIFNDQQTIQAAEANMRDEVEMQRWLIEHMPEACILTFQKEGLTIPQDVQNLAQNPDPIFNAVNLNVGYTGGASTQM